MIDQIQMHKVLLVLSFEGLRLKHQLMYLTQLNHEKLFSWKVSACPASLIRLEGLLSVESKGDTLVETKQSIITSDIF